MLVTIPVPNLVSGVSQQPDALKLVTSVKELLNSWPSVVNGLVKRHPTEHVGNLGFTYTDGAAGHLIDKSDDYQYVITIADADLKVFSLSGTEQPVDFPNGKTYLETFGTSKNKFRFYTIADTTFIVNRDVVVDSYEIGEEGADAYTPDAEVPQYPDLPSPSVTYSGSVYRVEATNKYYKCELIPATDDKYGWAFTGETWDYGSFPYTNVTVVQNTLPYPVSADQEGTLIYLYRTGWNEASSQSGSNRYYEYEGVKTADAVPAHYAWVEKNISELTTVTNDRLPPQTRGTVYVTNSISNSYYSIYINGILEATFLTNNGVDAANALQGTDVIAEELSLLLTAEGFANTRYGSTIELTSLDSDDEIVVTSSNGDKCIKCFRNEIGAFSDLPPNAAEGRIVLVRGDPEKNQDDYYVIFQDGLWVETYGYGQYAGLNPATMPHILVRNTDGSWTFKQHEWEFREVGDAESNPHPSFVGNKINDIYPFTNRLGFLTSSNIILSQANVYENFYRTTIATLIDSDPIDMGVLGAANDDMYHVVPFNKDLLILAGTSQHRVSYSNYVGPKNIKVDFTTSFNCSPYVHPINMGNSVYFIDDRREYDWAKVYEYYPQQNNQGDDAKDVSDPIPQYISSNIQLLAGSPRLNCMMLVSEDDPTTVFLYKFYWNDNKKIQNAWGKWTFDDAEEILWADFTGDDAYFIIKRPTGTFLESMCITEELTTADGARICLDRRATGDQLTMSYSGGTGLTTIELPYTTDETVVVVSKDDNGLFYEHEVTRVDNNTVTVPTDITERTVWVGIRYEWAVAPSRPYVRVSKGQGEVVVLDNRLQVRRATFEYHSTFRITATLVVRGRTFTKTLTYREAEDGNWVLPILSQSDSFTLRLSDNGPFNVSLGPVEWMGEYTPKAKRT